MKRNISITSVRIADTQRTDERGWNGEVRSTLSDREYRTTRASSINRHRGMTNQSAAAAVRAPRVSVVIPCYNCAGTIVETLTSVFAQTFADFEVVLVNDGSPDTRTLEQAIAPWRDRLTYVRTANRGVAAARNSGIRASRGGLVALLDSDDIWQPNYLQVQVSKLDADPTADIVYPNAITFGDEQPPVELLQSEGEVTFTSLVQETCVVFTSVLARREAFERVGLLDESLRRCEDYDLWLRCVKAGSRIIYHSEILVRYRRTGSGSLSSDEAEMHAQALRVLLKMRNTLMLTDEERQVVDQGIRRQRYHKLLCEGKQAFKTGDIAMAVDRLEQANACVPNRKLAIVVAALRMVPYSGIKTAYQLRLQLRMAMMDLRHRIFATPATQDPIAA